MSDGNSFRKPLHSAPKATTSGARQSLSPIPLRQRTLQPAHDHGQGTESLKGPSLTRRRSSMLSFSSMDEAAQTWTDEIINPTTSRSMRVEDEDQVTHWHAIPIIFALLPALGGLFFDNGSAFLTDVLLLGLAAIFMNWSIRLPWDWYYSAQEQRRVTEVLAEIGATEATSNDDAVESASDLELPDDRQDRYDDIAAQPSTIERERAAAVLRWLELLALCATFVFPVLAAYLLHFIRAQLSTPSTTLVSDYNLSIFLLAAEVRPCRQLARLVSRRTLHLQRLVAGTDGMNGNEPPQKTVVRSLTSRLFDLETQVAASMSVPQEATAAQKASIVELSTEIRKRYEPRLEALDRAVRRYEKRSTTLALVTDQRLAQLEKRLNDALSLAAVAAEHTQRRPITKLVDGTVSLIMLPFQIAWQVFTLPARFIDEVYREIRGYLFWSTPRRNGRRGGPNQPSTKRDDKATPRLLR